MTSNDYSSTVSVGRNERFWTSQMINYINEIAKAHIWRIKSAGGEITIKTRENRMFPDIILYGDTLQHDILQGWEVKCPDVLITDTEFIADASRKARILNLNSYVIWNFTYCKLYIKNENDDYNCVRNWNIDSIMKREHIDFYRKKWESLLKEVLDTINNYLNTGQIQSKKLSFTVSKSIIPEIITTNKVLVSEYLKECSKTNTLIDATIDNWWKATQKEYMADETDMYIAYAKCVLLHWANRFLFANIIKGYHDPAKEVGEIIDNITPDKADDIFDKISSACDFYNIFTKINYDDLLPEVTWECLLDFNSFLNINNFTKINPKTLQNILETTVTNAKQEIAGMYTTPPDIARLIVESTITNTQKICIDPCCGTGTFINAIIKYKKKHGSSIEDSYSTTWGSDINSFPLQIANINLASGESMNIPVRLFRSNVFELNEDTQIPITNPENGKIINFTLPKFDIIISNLPFVDFNTNNEESTKYFEKIINDVKEKTGILLSKRGDLYQYILFHIWNLLENDGYASVIVSNSWLGTNAGITFYSAIRNYFHVRRIFTSGNGRWFKNAKVITVILMLQKKNVGIPNKEDLTEFGIIKKEINEFKQKDVFQSIKNCILLEQNQNCDNEIMRKKSYSNDHIDSLLKMGVSLNALFHNIDWYYDISDKLCKITQKFNIFRGERTGQDEIFYPDDPSCIDFVYLKPCLKNSKNCHRLTASPDSKIIICEKTFDELKKYEHTKTLSWFDSFIPSLNKTVKDRGALWYQISPSKSASLFTSMNPYERIFFGRFNVPTFINQRLIGFSPKDENVDLVLCHALLNSMLGIFAMEACAFGMGLSALDTSKENIAKNYMLDPNIITSKNKTKILEAFQPLLDREIKTTLEELSLSDRINFEHIVLDAYGIDNYFDNIKTSIISMQTTRLSVRS